WRPHVGGGALVRRARGDDAEGGWAIRLSSRSVLAPLGFSLRLDVVPRHPDGNDSRGRGRLLALYGCANPMGFRIKLPGRTDSPRRLCPLALDGATRRAAAYRAAHVHEHARVEAR